MIQKIAHLADVHFQNNLDRLAEQKHISSVTIKSLLKDRPDLIVIAGDLFHNYVKPFNEINVLAGDFLTSCATIAPVVIIDGNHDIMKSNLNRMSSIKMLVEIINNPNIHYYDSTGFFEFDNITFAVWYHPDRKSPWFEFNQEKRDNTKFYIDLFHDPINGCYLQNGQLHTDNNIVSLADFKGDIVMAGDIHLQQSYQKNGKEFFAYPSSLYCTNYGEGDNAFHGYLLWDIKAKTFEKKEIISDYKYFNIYINEDYDYENLDIELKNVGKHNHVKIHWMDQYSTFTNENKQKIKKHLESKYGEFATIKFDKSKILNKSLKIKEFDDTIDLNNNDSVRQEFINFLKAKNHNEEFINDVLALDTEISSLIENDVENQFYDWKIKKIVLDNFKSHGERYELDLSDKNGIIQIFGENQVGKCVHPETKINIRYNEEEIIAKLGYLPEFLK
jgi:DNA repair exonuclease SbcCD nuclease subunit